MLLVGMRRAAHEQRQLAEKHAAIYRSAASGPAIQRESGAVARVVLHKHSTPLRDNPPMVEEGILKHVYPWDLAAGVFVASGVGLGGAKAETPSEIGQNLLQGASKGRLRNNIHSLWRKRVGLEQQLRVLPQYKAVRTHKMLRDEEEYDFEELALEHTWTFWHHPHVESKSEKDYEDALRQLCDFSTVQDFWRCFNNLPSPTELRKKSTLHMMKRGVAPKWEDPYNENGGHWVIRLKKDATENVWKDLVLTIIGEQLTVMLNGQDEICGVSVSVRDYDNVIRIWNRNANSSVREDILTSTKSLFSESDARLTFYKAHKNLKHEKRYQQRKDSAGGSSPRLAAKTSSLKSFPARAPSAPKTIHNHSQNRRIPDSHRYHTEPPTLHSRSFENDGWAGPRVSSPNDAGLWKRGEEHVKPKAQTEGYSRKLEYPPGARAPAKNPSKSNNSRPPKPPRRIDGRSKAPTHSSGGPSGASSGMTRSGGGATEKPGRSPPSFTGKSGGKQKKGRSKSHLGNKAQQSKGRGRSGSRKKSGKSTNRKPKQTSPPKRHV